MARASWERELRGHLSGIRASHPRAESLRVRARLAAGSAAGLVAPEGLIAHGRGEAFDYMLGEKSRAPAKKAARAGALALLAAKRPAISVNGNVAALCPAETVELARAVGAKIEVNTFYGPAGRRALIARHLEGFGAERVYGAGRRRHRVPGLGGPRGAADSAVHEADAVLVALEDGDRTEALVRAGKKVVAVDLNPFSRTARRASITIVDNIVRAVPLIAGYAAEGGRKAGFDNGKCLRECARLARAGA